ncbi:peptidoglycan D,D-transpeptidase FtsI family protein [Caminicella sporogenes]|uniref:peptidoglycan D,D-transpeptidase FtsI family protein n=1 Tax=Caminicella sporogenes TaxID=166485 RepID=UPI0025414FCD|nr:penicillin-binding protein 2 [Caminicella sporogenes]WIF94507.1 penicillin-binding protein 2 [Caminicella sporogenes]
MSVKDNKDKSEKGLKKLRKRLTIMFMLVTVILICLIGRLCYIQIIKGNDLRQMAVKQWSETVSIVDKRGKIYDRNYIPLTSRVKEDYIIIHPSIKLNDKVLNLLSISTKLDVETLKKVLSKKDRYKKLLIKYYDIDILRELLSMGIQTVEITKRYDGSRLASHVIGYIKESENAGMSGLEKYFDTELTKDRGIVISAVKDAKNRIIPGFGYAVYKGNDNKKENIVTTIDYNIQKISEKEFDKYNFDGSVVVLDSKSGDILAMVSRPNFDPDNVANYLNSNNMELYNKAVQISFPPGSIFKIIVAAAAIEKKLVDMQQNFYCKGYEKLGKDIIIKCHSYEKGGHGNLNLKQAFAASCNSVFIQIGQILGGEEILNMAKKFGLGKKTGIKIDKETEGVLPTEDYVKGAGIGNISIGQGCLEVTPLQVAKFTNIIANNGIDVGVRLVKEVISDNGKVKKKFKKDSINRVISSDTAQKIKDMMIQTVKEGTGRAAKMDDIEVAGKTGSAETVVRGQKTVHAWFTGFFDGKKSRYVITIIAERKGSGGKFAAPIFKNIAKRLIEMGY